MNLYFSASCLIYTWLIEPFKTTMLNTQARVNETMIFVATFCLFLTTPMFGLSAKLIHVCAHAYIFIYIFVMGFNTLVMVVHPIVYFIINHRKQKRNRILAK
jgi:hypothetical protein